MVLGIILYVEKRVVIDLPLTDEGNIQYLVIYHLSSSSDYFFH